MSCHGLGNRAAALDLPMPRRQPALRVSHWHQPLSSPSGRSSQKPLSPYMRRHKTVSLEIPCITGPYTTVSCKLTLVNNRYRRTTDILAGAYKKVPGNDTQFVYNIGNDQSVATTTCQADSGLFEVNFHDERYLPFSGTDVLGTWLLELPDVLPQIDYNIISDVVLQIRYTAREGRSTLATPVKNGQLDELNNLVHDVTEKDNGLFQASLLPQQFPQNGTSWFLPRRPR